MKTQDKGGPAFPVHPQMAEQLGCQPSSSDAGMTLRDYFAAKAMAEFLAEDLQQRRPGGFEECAEQAYRAADAMLAERKVDVQLSVKLQRDILLGALKAIATSTPESTVLGLQQTAASAIESIN